MMMIYIYIYNVHAFYLIVFLKLFTTYSARMELGAEEGGGRCGGIGIQCAGGLRAGVLGKAGSGRHCARCGP